MNDTCPYDVQYDPRALKELGKLDKRWRVALRVRSVSCATIRARRPLAGFPDLWRMRVGDYRAVYTIRDTELVVIALRIAHRSSVYRSL